MIIYIPGWLIGLLTFPGVILHEIAHRFFCDVCDVPVYKVIYFRPFSRKAGAVYHAPTDNLRHAFFIGIAPLLINSLVCILTMLPVMVIVVYIMVFGIGGSAAHSLEVPVFMRFIFVCGAVLSWIGLSAGYHAFPSNEDINKLSMLAKTRRSRWLLKFFSVFMRVLNADRISFLFRIGYILLITLLPAYLITLM